MASVSSSDSSSSREKECNPPNNSPSSSPDLGPSLLSKINSHLDHETDPNLDPDTDYHNLADPVLLGQSDSLLGQNDGLMLDSGDDFTDAEDDLSLPTNRAVAKSEITRMLPAVSEAIAPIDEGQDNVLPHRSKVEIISTTSRAAVEHAEEFVHKVWEAGWRVAHHASLPDWLKDNEYLMKGHRPPTNSFAACFKSIFRIHTETGNIWTHLLGFIAFIGVAIYFLTRPSVEIQWQEKAVFSAFFAGAILCLGFSWIFHTVYCHSERVGKFFNKLDYCGIALLTMGSFVPWLYYSFYCRLEPKIAYLILIFVLGISCIVVSLWDKFSQPQYRGIRAGVFIGLGLSGIIPAMHYVITDGFYHAINCASLGWLALMALLYISGAIIYAVRIPERLFPGKFDIWFQSHQIFHVFVVAAAFVHYHGITAIANYRLTLGDCLETRNS
ncbi:adiponectin receptor protein 1 isoform X2 [Octopus bimaculoides]|uniref:Adiponectin receptor n=1 Tax=Octopus bimaculoides TaxID=37653 RepID=A0A0L8HT40_OCTBM|nr:adiponectin receptor protein 1 isoform X2 [Octopus bimaculoides]|eukprot:XP_014769625.1 PREDICTED: adiponectin receptor protein 1-like isoform X2 [Octopus bimaculoides]